MPFTSQAQKNKLAKLVDEGKLSKTTFDNMEAGTKNQVLPTRAAPKLPQTPKVGKVKMMPVIK